MNQALAEGVVLFDGDVPSHLLEVGQAPQVRDQVVPEQKQVYEFQAKLSNFAG